MKILNFLLPAFSFVLTSFGLEINWQYVALAIGASVSGSLLLGFYRPERTVGRMVYKMIMSAIAGLIFGSALIAWRQVEVPAYVGMIYCLASLLTLFFLKSLVSLGQSNADSLTRTVIQRIFNIPVRDVPAAGANTSSSRPAVDRGKNRRGKGVHIQQIDDQKPIVTIDPGAKPDEVRVIEQTQVEKSEP